jgi:hypothetical protein
MPYGNSIKQLYRRPRFAAMSPYGNFSRKAFIGAADDGSSMRPMMKSLFRCQEPETLRRITFVIEAAILSRGVESRCYLVSEG